MDDDIYTADGRPHIPLHSHDQEVIDPGSSNHYLDAINSSTNLSKALPNNPPTLQPPYFTHNEENAGQGGHRGTDGDGDGDKRNSLMLEFRTSSDLLISSVPDRVSSSSQNHFNDLSHEDLAVTAGQGENSLSSTNYQFRPGNEPVVDLSEPSDQTLEATANLSFGPTDEWQAELSRRMDELQKSARNGTYEGPTSNRSSLRNDNLVGARNAQASVEGDSVVEPVQKPSSTDSVSAGGESSGQIVAPRRSSRRAVRFSQDVREVVLPRWQPDAEVTYCPICHTQFSFFVRKHHCRRCGRVVCNACSPHRITIPYQFIVQPPAAILATSATAAAQLGSHRDSFVEDASSNFADRNGGMKVRLCNPCVPDPNPLPPQQFPDDTGPPTLYLARGNILTRENRPRSYIDESTSNNLGRIRGMSAASALRASDPVNTFTNNRSSLIPPMVPSFNYSHPAPPNAPSKGHDVSASSRYRHPYSSSPGQSSQNRGHGNRLHHQSLSFTPGASAPNLQPHYRSLLDVGSDHTRTPSSTARPLPPVPRLDDDDICPICHRALPSRAFVDFEDQRAAHVTQCIDEQLVIHSGQASRPAAYASHSQPGPESSNRPSQQQQQYPHSLISLSTPESRTVVHGYNNSNPTPNSAPIATPGRHTGMFVYLASEKDCVDDAECTICLEEFVVGAQMARLECFCRFHKKCIGDWFVDHPGRCPMHSHDSFGF